MTRNEEIALALAAGITLIYVLRKGGPGGEKKANGITPKQTGSDVWSQVTDATKPIWPIDPLNIKRVGQTVMADRNNAGRPHKGVDIFADSGTQVRAAQRGRVVQVTDGRQSSSDTRKAAGLWIDIESTDKDKPLYRYLHLGESFVKEGDRVEQGTILATIAPAFTSGLADAPHLHFEIRAQDAKDNTGYGTPINPLTRLPSLGNIA